ATLIEAAEIDGARTWSKFRHLTVPLLGPATLFLVVWSTINALQLFDEVYFLTRGGPGTATYVVVYYLYDLAFAQGIAGYAAAIAYVLLLAIMSLTLIQLWVGRRWVYYASRPATPSPTPPGFATGTARTRGPPRRACGLAASRARRAAGSCSAPGIWC